MTKQERFCFARVVDYMEEMHAPEVADDHGGDGAAGCTYCRAIREAREVLNQTE